MAVLLLLDGTIKQPAHRRNNLAPLSRNLFWNMQLVQPPDQILELLPPRIRLHRGMDTVGFQQSVLAQELPQIGSGVLRGAPVVRGQRDGQHTQGMAGNAPAQLQVLAAAGQLVVADSDRIELGQGSVKTGVPHRNPPSEAGHLPGQLVFARCPAEVSGKCWKSQQKWRSETPGHLLTGAYRAP